MAQLLNRVQRGDVITADMWNLVVDAVNELLQAGQTLGIKIAAMVPAGTINEPIRIGTLLQITGQNFGYSISQSSVTFEGLSGSVPVKHDQMLTGSSDSRLLLIVPPIPGLPQAGAPMTLRVDNGIAHDVRSVFVMPIIITLQGDIFVSWRADITPNPQPNPLQPQQSAEFRYKLETGINMPATFDLSVNIPNATAAIPEGLVSSIEIRDEGGKKIPNNRIEMGKNEIRNIYIFIPQIPVSFTDQSFTLSVSAASGNIVNTDSRSFTVGKAVIPSDPDIELNQTGWNAKNITTLEPDPNHNNALLEGSNIKLKVDWRIIIMFNVLFKKKGTFDIWIQPKKDQELKGWLLKLPNTSEQIITLNDNESKFVQFGLEVPSTSDKITENGTVVFRINRHGATSDQSKEYNVQLWK